MSETKIIGIYCIKNIINNKRYVGSSNDIKHRWKEHKFLLNNKNHHSIRLQNSWNKHGEKNFIFEIIELLEDQKNLLSKEQYFLDFFSSYEPEKGYNVSKFTCAPFKGRNHTEDTKNLQSIKNSGCNHWAFGKHLTEEHKEKISSVKRKIPKSQEKNVLENYRILKNAYEVAKIYNVHAETIYRILRKHNIHRLRIR